MIHPEDYKRDTKKLKDKMGRPLTQGLFLEIDYNVDFAMFTLNSEDKVYKGKTYPSLKRLYLEFGDVVEINFANHFLVGWDQWQRMANSQILLPHISKWREELELMVKAEALQNIIDQAGDNFQASKWLAGKGWEVRTVGRPSKAEKKSMARQEQEMLKTFDEDIKRMDTHKIN